MALPTPVSPLALPSYEQDRGTILFDAETKSTRQKPSGYKKNDVCDQDAYRVLGAALSINQLTNDCRVVLGGSGSISLTVPAGAVAADIDTIVNALVIDLKAALAAQAAN